MAAAPGVQRRIDDAVALAESQLLRQCETFLESVRMKEDIDESVRNQRFAQDMEVRVAASMRENQKLRHECASLRAKVGQLRMNENSGTEPAAENSSGSLEIALKGGEPASGDKVMLIAKIEALRAEVKDLREGAVVLATAKRKQEAARAAIRAEEDRLERERLDLEEEARRQRTRFIAMEDQLKEREVSVGFFSLSVLSVDCLSLTLNYTC